MATIMTLSSKGQPSIFVKHIKHVPKIPILGRNSRQMSLGMVEGGVICQFIGGMAIPQNNGKLDSTEL